MNDFLRSSQHVLLGVVERTRPIICDEIGIRRFWNGRCRDLKRDAVLPILLQVTDLRQCTGLKKKKVLRFLRCCVLECCEAFTIFSDFELLPNALPDIQNVSPNSTATNCNKKPQHKTASEGTNPPRMPRSKNIAPRYPKWWRGPVITVQNTLTCVQPILLMVIHFFVYQEATKIGRVHCKRPGESAATGAGVARCRIQGKVASIFLGAFRSLSLVLRTCFVRHSAVWKVMWRSLPVWQRQMHPGNYIIPET